MQKVNQILGHFYALYFDDFKGGLPFTVYNDDFKAWAPYLCTTRCGPSLLDELMILR